MESVKIKLVFDRKKVCTDSNSQGVIEVYVYDPLSRKKTYISTGIYVSRSQYKQNGYFAEIVNHPNKVGRNNQLKKIYRDIEAFVLSDDCKNIDDVKNRNKDVDNYTSVVSFIEQQLKRKDNSRNTISQHKTLIKRLEEFGRFKTFKDLTYNNILDFDEYLVSTGLNSVTAYKRHSIFHGYIKQAINMGLCNYDPYVQFKPKKGKSKDPVYLTECELISIHKFNLVDNDRLNKVRDLFVFQCYTGLAYIDLSKFDKKDICEIDGYRVIRGKRQKTDQEYITLLLPEALEVLEKYNYNLPIISNQKYNDYLKILSLHIVDDNSKPIITKRLTTHVARHTYATYLLNKNVPIEVVSRSLGHSDTKMTRHYAKLMGRSVVSSIVENVLKKPT